MKAEEEVLVQTMNSQLGDRQKPGSFSSEVNEAKEEDGYEENVEEDVAVAADDEDDGKV